MRQTKKFVAGRRLLRQLNISAAGNHYEVYGALTRRGYTWDPKMGREGGWYKETERVRAPIVPAIPPARRPDPCESHEPRPARCEACGTLEIRVNNLEAHVVELVNRLAELTPDRPRGALISGLSLQGGPQ